MFSTRILPACSLLLMLGCAPSLNPDDDDATTPPVESTVEVDGLTLNGPATAWLVETRTFQPDSNGADIDMRGFSFVVTDTPDFCEAQQTLYEKIADEHQQAWEAAFALLYTDSYGYCAEIMDLWGDIQPALEAARPEGGTEFQLGTSAHRVVNGAALRLEVAGEPEEGIVDEDNLFGQRVTYEDSVSAWLAGSDCTSPQGFGYTQSRDARDAESTGGTLEMTANGDAWDLDLMGLVLDGEEVAVLGTFEPCLVEVPEYPDVADL